MYFEMIAMVYLVNYSIISIIGISLFGVKILKIYHINNFQEYYGVL